jgi:hypothetical protein
MTIENNVLREDLRAWTKSREIGLPEYLADLQVQRRVGNIITSGASYWSDVEKGVAPFGRTCDRQLSGARCIP